GTAQIPVPGGYGDGRIASFIGAAPAEDPEVVTLVVLYDPQTEVRYGGDLAAPVFADVTELALEHRHIPRSHMMRARSGGGSRSRDAVGALRSPLAASAAVRPPRDPLPAPRTSGLDNGGGTGEAFREGAPPPAAEPMSLPPTLPPLAGGDDWWQAYRDPAWNESLPASVTVPDVTGATIRGAIDALEA